MTLDPNQQPASQPPEPGAPAQRPMVPSFIPPSVIAAAATPKPRSRVPAGTVAFVAAIVVAAAGLGFAGGRVTAPAATGRAFNGNPNGNGFPTASGAAGAGRNGGLGGFGAFAAGDIAVTGKVTAVASGSITIQTAAGESVTVEVPSTATYHAQATAASTDVGVGTQVQLTVNRPGGFRGPDASGAPAPSSAQPGNGTFALTATDVLVLGK